MLQIKIPVAKEGTPFIGISSLATLTFSLLGWEIPATIMLILTAFILYFFRDTERVIPADENLVVSPADGRIIEINNTSFDPINGAEATKISIFMNIFNCHINRSPISGRIKEIRYREGSFISANLEGASMKNEQNAVLIHGVNELKCTTVQVAGLIARRIVCWVEPEDNIKRGERIGMIRFGSRLDVYLSKGVQVTVQKRAKVFAGQSILAKFPGKTEATS
jgi:phosphatidylserine decarboxylase